MISATEVALRWAQELRSDPVAAYLLRKDLGDAQLAALFGASYLGEPVADNLSDVELVEECRARGYTVEDPAN